MNAYMVGQIQKLAPDYGLKFARAAGHTATLDTGLINEAGQRGYVTCTITNFEREKASDLDALIRMKMESARVAAKRLGRDLAA